MKKLIIFSILVLISSPLLMAKNDTEDVLKAANTRFLKQIRAENPEYSQRISELLEYVLNKKKSGARVLDRFGIFLNDCRKNNMVLKKTYFSSGKRHFTVFLVLQDRSDSQEYILFTHYSYDASQKTCKLVDIYFSLVFDAKMKSMKALFSDDDNFTSKDADKRDIINSYRE